MLIVRRIKPDTLHQVKELADVSEADEVMITSMIATPAEHEFTIREMKAAWDKIDR